jgi:pimeloyl-ACP methyl ester carboxylesterase
VSTFALVHGAWHGAWCWERLTPELEARAHRVVAPDLPSDDPTATFIDYADVVLDALEGEDDVVLVGHSLAGNTIPLVAARRLVRRLVYLCAVVPIPGRSFNEQATIERDMFFPGYEAGLIADGQGRSSWVDEEIARLTFFADCDERDAHAAFERLRPQSTAPYNIRCPIEGVPAAPHTYVVCAEDRIVNPDWSRRVARERLAAELVELPGSHSPFLSRPAALAEVLCGS